MNIFWNNKRFSVFLFIFTNISITIFFIVAVSTAFPELMRVQLAQSWARIVCVFVLVHFCLCFIEFFLHRYALHARLPLLGHFFEKHTHHHSLTTVVMEGTLNSNHYPIIKDEQYESSFFPWYTLIIFACMLTPVFILIAFITPTTPILISGYLAMLFSLALYEFIHLVLHYPFARWEKIISNRHIGRAVRTGYSFHLAHHACIRNNESVSGFFGIPVADILFGTVKIPKNLYTPHEPAYADDFVPARPVWFIRALDKVLQPQKTSA